MPKDVKAFRIFIASPGGLQKERQRFRDTVEEFNKHAAMPNGVLFEAVGWEDTLGGAGRPQTIINKDVRTCDYFVMVLWDRWGSRPGKSPKGKFSSGTQEEFHVAKSCLRKRTMRHIVILFKSPDARQLSDPGKELKPVLTFRKELEKTKGFLFHTFDDEAGLRDLLQRFLNSWLMDHVSVAKGARPTSPKQPSNAQPMVAEESRLTSGPSNPLITKARELANYGRLTESEALFARATETGNDPEALYQYASFLSRTGRLMKAQELLEDLLVLSGRAGRKWASYAYLLMGYVHAVQGQGDEAERKLKRALEIAREIDEPTIAAWALARVSYVLLKRRDLSGAEKAITEAIDGLRRVGDKPILARALAIYSRVLRSKDYARAEETLREARTLAKRARDRSAESFVMLDQGSLLLQLSRLGEAEQLYREALMVNKAMGDVEGIAYCHHGLGLVLEESNSDGEARLEYESALASYQQLNALDRVAEVRSAINTLDRASRS